MLTYGKFQAVKVHYDASGTAIKAEEDAFIAELSRTGFDNLVVISHGWNNDETEADGLYNRFFTAVGNMAHFFPSIVPSRTLVLAVVWPSKKFDENVFAAVAGSLPGGIAAVDSSAVRAASLAPDAVDSALATQLVVLKEITGDGTSSTLLDHAIAQIANLGVSESAQDDFVSALARAFPAPPQASDPGLDQGLATINTTPGHTVLQSIARTLGAQSALTPPAAALPEGTFATDSVELSPDGPQPLQLDSAAGFDPLQSIKNAALALANVTTYWAMKERAGVVGSTGLARTLAKALSTSPKSKVHLVGHSFGGRLVTAAANALPGGSSAHQVSTMLLLQAAYSHFGMAKDYWPGTDGVFRSVITSSKVKSLIQITHSAHDLAVGLAYPIASALAQQIGEGLFVNPWGGMGSDGAQKTPETVNEDLRSPASHYVALVPPIIVRNLNGDNLIMSHGDVTHDEIAYAFLSAVVAAT